MTSQESSDSPRLGKGLVSIVTGNGKGKTTSAIGSIVRASGHGLQVYVIFFAKGGNFKHGEFQVLNNIPNVTMASYGQRGWLTEGDPKPEHKEKAQQAFAAVREAMLSGKYDLVVMDEINIAISGGLIDLEDVVKLIEDKPAQVELILTGRNANPKLVRLADLVSEILMIKHPFNEGIKARKGIDY